MFRVEFLLESNILRCLDSQIFKLIAHVFLHWRGLGWVSVLLEQGFQEDDVGVHTISNSLISNYRVVSTPALACWCKCTPSKSIRSYSTTVSLFIMAQAYLRDHTAGQIEPASFHFLDLLRMRTV